MGGISSSGLVSGIDTQSIVNQLLDIEGRPKIFAQQRTVQLQTQQAAYLDINSQLLALRTSAGELRFDRLLDTSKATSSHSSILTARASSSASPGAYTFIVNRLVTSEQQISRGFTDRDVSGVGLTSLSVEVGGGALTSDTRLADLNGGDGVARGKIVVTDRTGGSAEVDLSTAVTVGEVLERINGASGVSVLARVEGDRIVIEDESGGGGTLRVENAFGSDTASSLGILGTSVTGTITGSQINRLAGGVALAALNDGTG